MQNIALFPKIVAAQIEQNRLVRALKRDTHRYQATYCNALHSVQIDQNNLWYNLSDRVAQWRYGQFQAHDFQSGSDLNLLLSNKDLRFFLLWQQEQRRYFEKEVSQKLGGPQRLRFSSDALHRAQRHFNFQDIPDALVFPLEVQIQVNMILQCDARSFFRNNLMLALQKDQSFVAVFEVAYPDLIEAFHDMALDEILAKKPDLFHADIKHLHSLSHAMHNFVDMNLSAYDNMMLMTGARLLLAPAGARRFDEILDHIVLAGEPVMLKELETAISAYQQKPDAPPSTGQDFTPG